MAAPRQDPYLWIHLAGLATLPLWVDGCLAGLAVGDPSLPMGLELGLLYAIGIVPVLWMQWQRPFYLFSALVVAMRPDKLTPDRQRLLTLQRTWPGRGIALGAAFLLAYGLWSLYPWAPVAAEATPLAGLGRGVGWGVAAIAFLGANLFLQVALSALRLLWVSPSALATAEPYPVASVLQNFTVVGLRVPQILPDILPSVLNTPEVEVPEPAPVNEPPGDEPRIDEPSAEASAMDAFLGGEPSMDEGRDWEGVEEGDRAIEPVIHTDDWAPQDAIPLAEENSVLEEDSAPDSDSVQDEDIAPTGELALEDNAGGGEATNFSPKVEDVAVDLGSASPAAVVPEATEHSAPETSKETTITSLDALLTAPEDLEPFPEDRAATPENPPVENSPLS